MRELWLQALFFGALSAVSLPLGALLGLWLEPSEGITAKLMAFGSGALICAVAIQLYGQPYYSLLASSPDPFEGPRDACDENCQGHFRNVLVQVVSGLLGSMLYWALNRLIPYFSKRCLGRSLGGEPRGPNRPSQREDTFGTSSQRLQGGSSLNVAASGGRVSRHESGRLERQGSNTPSLRRMRSQSIEEEEEVAGDGIYVAFSMWLGLMLDGIPESLMLGFMTNEGKVTYALLIAIFIANFPEAFSGAAELQRSSMMKHRNMMMWSSICVATGLLAMVGSLVMPESIPEHSILEEVRTATTTSLEGLTGGAMLAMISTAMMPAAFKGTGEAAGVFMVLGFVCAVMIGGLGARFGPPQNHISR